MACGCNHRFGLSLRDVQELMAERGVEVSHESIRAWCERFGPTYAKRLRHRQPRPGDRWHLDEVFIKINGKQRYLWRAVDQHGNILDVLVTSRRNAKAAKRFFKKLLKGWCYVPRRLVTDQLNSYMVAHRELMASVTHRRSKYLNNRAENSHRTMRRRERAMQGFKSVGGAQRFLTVFSEVCQLFRHRRHRMSAPEYRTLMSQRFTQWQEVTETVAA